MVIENPRHAIRVLLAVIVLLMASHVAGLAVAGRWPYLAHLVNVGKEQNIPTWFSSVVLALAAVAAFRCAKSAQPDRRAWIILGMGLLFMSCDEVAMIHEKVSSVSYRWVTRAPAFEVVRPVLLHIKAMWVLAVAPLVILWVGWIGYTLRKWVRSHRTAATLMVVGAMLYFGGSMGIELLKYALPRATPPWVWEARKLVEEGCEMVGSVTLLAGLLGYGAWISRAGREDAA
jgi:hypothetical protein